MYISLQLILDLQECLICKTCLGNIAGLGKGAPGVTFAFASFRKQGLRQFLRQVWMEHRVIFWRVRCFIILE